MRPKLSEEQKKQLAECFELMDADGSGAIDAQELGAAFKVCPCCSALDAAAMRCDQSLTPLVAPWNVAGSPVQPGQARPR